VSVRTFAVIVLSMMASSLLVRAAPAQEEIQHITRAGLKQMLENPGTETVGSPKPDVIIVEYFDYNCPFCKNLVPVLKALLAQDHGVAILYKDWPILGDMSMYGAASALAAGCWGPATDRAWVAPAAAASAGPERRCGAAPDATDRSSGPCGSRAAARVGGSGA